MNLLRTLFTTTALALVAAVGLTAQPVVDQDGDMGLGTLEPHPSALLDMVSTTKGFVGPRMTEVQRDAIVNPTEGLIIYNLDATEYQYFDGFVWIPIGLTAGAFWELDGNAIASEYTGIGPSPGEQFLGTTSADDLSIVTFMNQNIDFWTNNVERFSVTAGGDIVPTNNNDISLGSDANRFADVFVNGASVHIGNAIGDEMLLEFGTISPGMGTIAVPGGVGPQIQINGASSTIAIDPTGNSWPQSALWMDSNPIFDFIWMNIGSVNTFNPEFTIDPTGSGIAPLPGFRFDANDDANADVQIDLAGDLIAFNDLNVQGSADIDTDLNVDGVITAAGAGHTLGTPAVDAGVLSILGDPNNVGNYELFVDGDAQITGQLNLASLTPGSVVFIDGAGNLAEDNPNFFWDDTDNELGIGTNTPGAGVDIVETGTTPGLRVIKSGTGVGMDVFSSVLAPTAAITNGGGAQALVATNNNGNPTIQAANNGAGNAGFFSKSTGGIATVQVSALGGGNAEGIRVENNSTGGNGDGIFVDHTAATGTNSAIEAHINSTDGNAWAIVGQVDPTNPGGFSTGVRGINNSTTFNGIGVWGTQNGSGWGVYGNSPDGVGVRGLSDNGVGGHFQNNGGVDPTVRIVDASAGPSLRINSNGGVGIDLNNGLLDGDAAANALGDGSPNQQLTVRGSADAVVGNTLGGNPTVWDLVVQGDVVATGIYKSGGSLWIDGVSATHNVTANAPLDVNTDGANDLTLSTNNTNAVVVDGPTQDVNILNDLDVDGDLNVDGITTLDQTTIDGNLLVTGNSDLQGPIFDGAGPLQLVDGTGIELTGPTTLNGSFNQSGGTNTFGGNATFNGATNTVNGGTFNVNAGTTNINSVVLNVNGLITNLNAPVTNVTGQLNATGGGNLAGTFTGNPTFSGNPAFTGTPTFTNIDVNGGTIDGTVIGGTAPANGTFQALTANGVFQANASANQIGNGGNVEQLQVNGVNGGAVEVDINGDVDISGNLTVGSFSFVIGSDLNMNGFAINDDGGDDIVNINDGLQVSDAATFDDDVDIMGDLMVDLTSTFTGAAEFDGTSQFDGTSTFNATSQFNAASTWGGPGAPVTSVAQGAMDVLGNVAGTPALEAENNAANGIAFRVPAGGGRMILSYGSGAGVGPIGGDVTVYEATGAGVPGLPAAASNGQVLYVINSSGAGIAFPAALGGNLPNGEMRTFVHAGGTWYPQG